VVCFLSEKGEEEEDRRSDDDDDDEGEKSDDDHASSSEADTEEHEMDRRMGEIGVVLFLLHNNW